MEFYCEICDYTAKSKSNLINHTKTKKHQLISEKLKNQLNNISNKKESKTYECEYCKKNFKHDSSYYRHKKNCNNDNNKISINELKLKLEYEIKEKELIKKIQEDQQTLFKEIMSNANNIINKSQDNNKVTTDALKTVSISAIKYANEKFKNAPALLPIQNFNINNLDFNNEEDKKQLVEILIYNAKQKSLDKLLGDHIVKEYKKEKPEEQMFHTTDCSRLNYIVRQLMEDALIWSVDKSGIEICSSIIKPLIKKCIDTLLEHQKYLLSEMGKGDLNKQTDVELIISILMSIDSGLLETDINKYIAPFFNLNKN
jgi:hypothetical protein